MAFKQSPCPFIQSLIILPLHTAMDIIKQILTDLETLLRDYDFIREANTVNGVIQLFSNNHDMACRQIMQESWWVGDDAVAEADLAIAGGFTAQAREDQDRFQELIIALYRQLSGQGYQSEFAKLVTSQYHKWLASRM